MGFFSSLFGGSDSSGGSGESNTGTKTNSYRSWSDVLSGNTSHDATCYDRGTGREIATGHGYSPQGAQKSLEGKLGKK